MVYGFNNYWRSAQNRFDFVITVTIGQSPCPTFKQDTDHLHVCDFYNLYTAELTIYYSVGLNLMLLIVWTIPSGCGDCGLLVTN